MQEYVEFRSGANPLLTLRGMTHVPPGPGPGPFPAVVFCHGLTGNRIESHFLFVTLARRLEKLGIASLRFDFAGSGESDGDFADMTTSGELADAERAVDYLCTRPDVDAQRLAVIGLSLGGCVAALLAGRRANQLKAAVLLAAVAEPAPIINSILMGKRGGQLANQGWIDMSGLKLSRAFIDELGTLDPLAAIAAFNRPVLVVHGTADNSVPSRQARSFADARARVPAPTDLHLLEGADHTFMTVDDTEKVSELIDAFLKKNL